MATDLGRMLISKYGAMMNWKREDRRGPRPLGASGMEIFSRKSFSLFSSIFLLILIF